MTDLQTMQGLIRVDYTQERPAVSARELHDFLQVETPYHKWFPRMCEYGFDEGESYWTFLSDRADGLPGKPRQDAALSIDMAKEICMLQRTERGKQARQYFIQLEKDWNSPEKVMARALKIANRKIEELEAGHKALEAQVEADRPKVIFANGVEASKDSILVGELAKLLKQNGVDIGQNRLFERLRREGYLIRRAGSDYNMPTQYSMNLGLFEIRETTINRPDGQIILKKTPRVTGKGQVYFINKFKKEAAS